MKSSLCFSCSLYIFLFIIFNFSYTLVDWNIQIFKGRSYWGRTRRNSVDSFWRYSHTQFISTHLGDELNLEWSSFKDNCIGEVLIRWYFKKINGIPYPVLVTMAIPVVKVLQLSLWVKFQGSKKSSYTSMPLAFWCLL